MVFVFNICFENLCIKVEDGDMVVLMMVNVLM